MGNNPRTKEKGQITNIIVEETKMTLRPSKSKTSTSKAKYKGRPHEGESFGKTGRAPKNLPITGKKIVWKGEDIISGEDKRVKKILTADTVKTNAKVKSVKVDIYPDLFSDAAMMYIKFKVPSDWKYMERDLQSAALKASKKVFRNTEVIDFDYDDKIATVSVEIPEE